MSNPDPFGNLIRRTLESDKTDGSAVVALLSLIRVTNSVTVDSLNESAALALNAFAA